MILIAGHLGSIGRRYCTILEQMRTPYFTFDTAIDSTEDIPSLLAKASRVLIATPTSTHRDWCMACIETGKPFLCEKPLAFSTTECKEILEAAAHFDVQGNVVCNYKFAFKESEKIQHYPVAFNYYNTGKDGFHWDCCQLIYINPDIKLNNLSPVWDMTTTFYKRERIFPYRRVEQGYIEMIDNWLFEGGKNLWTLEDGLKMTYATLERIQKDGN